MIKKFLRWQVVLIVLATMTIYIYTNNDARNKDDRSKKRQAEMQLEINRIKPKLSILKERFDASDLWIQNLSQDNYEESRRFSYYYEQLWTSVGSILVYGKILDITILDKENYLVILEFEGLSYTYSPIDIRFTLTASRKIIDEFLVQNTNIGTHYFSDNIAAAVTIDKVSLNFSSDDLDLVETQGKLNGIVSIGRYAVADSLISSGRGS
mgnify:CR=1 FL=1